MVYDVDKRFVFVNPKITNFTNIPPKDFIGKNHHDLGFSQDAANRLDAALDQVLTSEQDLHTHLEFTPGSFIDWFLSPHKDNAGKTIGVYTYASDISFLRRVEQELEDYKLNIEQLVQDRTEDLRKSESRLKDAIKLANLGSWEYDFATHQFSLGNQVMRMFGLPLGKGGVNILKLYDFQALIHPEDKSIYMESGRLARSSDHERYLDYARFRVIRPSGDVRHLLISIKVQIGSDGKHEKHYGTVQDITNLHQTEVEKDRLNTIIEVTPDVVGICDTEGNIIYLNQSGRKLFGLSKTGVLDNFQIQSVHSTRSFYKLLSIIRNMMKDKGIWSGDNRIKTADGREIPVSQVIIPHYNAKGNIEYFSSIIRDMSRQKLIEQDLLVKNSQLDTFVYRASHDLRGPIASLIGLHSVAEYEIKDEVSKKYMAMYFDQVKRLNNIVISLTELTRIKDKQADWQEIDFKEMVQESMASFAYVPDFNSIDFRISIRHKKPFISDIGFMRTILQNLIENAIKYRRPQDVGPSWVAVEVYDQSKENKIMIKVSDNGVGIPKSLHSKIFNMFFRGNERSQGSGLGLFILKSAVDRLQGDVTIESEELEGATFTVSLPYNRKF